MYPDWGRTSNLSWCAGQCSDCPSPGRGHLALSPLRSEGVSREGCVLPHGQLWELPHRLWRGMVAVCRALDSNARITCVLTWSVLGVPLGPTGALRDLCCFRGCTDLRDLRDCPWVSCEPRLPGPRWRCSQCLGAAGARAQSRRPSWRRVPGVPPARVCLTTSCCGWRYNELANPFCASQAPQSAPAPPPTLCSRGLSRVRPCWAVLCEGPCAASPPAAAVSVSLAL